MNLEELKERIKKFNNERDWDKFHSPENLSKSISIEAGELLECFQWDNDKFDKDCVKDEMADIFVYLLDLSNKLGIDLIEETNNKMDKNEQKYPIDKCKGKSTKYDKL